jgi:hypothetical protein
MTNARSKLKIAQVFNVKKTCATPSGFTHYGSPITDHRERCREATGLDFLDAMQVENLRYAFGLTSRITDH